MDSIRQLGSTSPCIPRSAFHVPERSERGEVVAPAFTGMSGDHVGAGLFDPSEIASMDAQLRERYSAQGDAATISPASSGEAFLRQIATMHSPPRIPGEYHAVEPVADDEVVQASSEPASSRAGAAVRPTRAAAAGVRRVVAAEAAPERSVKPKRSVKPEPSSSRQVRLKEKNRRAQRAFRERQKTKAAEHVVEIETLRGTVEARDAEITSLRARVAELEHENKRLRLGR